MAFTNGARNAVVWLTAEAGRLLCHLIGVPDDVIRTDVPQHPEIWGEICGWYKPRAQRTDMQARSMAGAGAQVVVRRGQLTLRSLSPIPALYRGFPLHPDDDKDPYVFRIDLSEYGLGTARVVFSPDTAAGTTRIHRDVMPMVLQKRPAPMNPRLWAAGAAGAVAGTEIAVHRRRRPTPGGLDGPSGPHPDLTFASTSPR
jgi:hypothetical protein